ncbi:hypothetical protein D3C87_1386380 [compost metagenome]
MRVAILSTILAVLALPMGAMACENCVYHGTAQEYAAWSTILAKGNPPAATASTSTRAAAPSKAGQVRVQKKRQAAPARR